MWRDGPAGAMGGGVSVGCSPWGLGSRCVTEGSSLGVASPSLPPDECPCVPPAVPFPRRGAGMLPGTQEQGVQSPGVAQERALTPRDLFRVVFSCVPRRDVRSVPFPPCPGGRAGAERGGRFFGVASKRGCPRGSSKRHGLSTLTPCPHGSSLLPDPSALALEPGAGQLHELIHPAPSAKTRPDH